MHDSIFHYSEIEAAHGVKGIINRHRQRGGAQTMELGMTAPEHP
jgi:hypothetical protein